MSAALRHWRAQWASGSCACHHLPQAVFQRGLAHVPEVLRQDNPSDIPAILATWIAGKGWLVGGCRSCLRPAAARRLCSKHEQVEHCAVRSLFPSFCKSSAAHSSIYLTLMPSVQSWASW